MDSHKLEDQEGLCEKVLEVCAKHLVKGAVLWAMRVNASV